MRKYKCFTGIVALLSLTMLLGAKTEDEQQGCGGGLDNRPGEPGTNVGGALGANWKIKYGDTVQVRVLKAGVAVATKSIAWAAGGTFKVDGQEVDLRKLCERGDVACPEQVFPEQVRMTQPGQDLHFLKVNFNKIGPLKEIKDLTLLGNVDSDSDFSIFLGVGAAANGACGLLSASYARGHIAGDKSDPPIGKSLDGSIVTVYSGACALIGVAAGAGAGLQVELKLPFSGTRQ